MDTARPTSLDWGQSLRGIRGAEVWLALCSESRHDAGHAPY